MSERLSMIAQTAREKKQLSVVAAAEKNAKSSAKRVDRISNGIAKRVIRAAVKGEETVQVRRGHLHSLRIPYDDEIFEATNEKLEPDGIQVTPFREKYMAATVSGYIFKSAESYTQREKEMARIELLPCVSVPSGEGRGVNP